MSSFCHLHFLIVSQTAKCNLSFYRVDFVKRRLIYAIALYMNFPMIPHRHPPQNHSRFHAFQLVFSQFLILQMCS